VTLGPEDFTYEGSVFQFLTESGQKIKTLRMTKELGLGFLLTIKN
jgi:hypothetical protein